MGRKKEGRDVPLYIRIKPENEGFLKKLCRLAEMSKTEWVDLHLDYLRNNMRTIKASTLVEKRRNHISESYQTAS